MSAFVELYTHDGGSMLLRADHVHSIAPDRARGLGTGSVVVAIAMGATRIYYDSREPETVRMLVDDALRARELEHS